MAARMSDIDIFPSFAFEHFSSNLSLREEKKRLKVNSASLMAYLHSKQMYLPSALFGSAHWLRALHLAQTQPSGHLGEALCFPLTTNQVKPWSAANS